MNRSTAVCSRSAPAASRCPPCRSEPRPMSFAECRLAVPADDPALRRLLRENPFEGSISLSFEREPDYFKAASVEGPFHQTMVVFESGTGEIMGMGDRSVRPLWVNGEVREV